MILFFIIYYFYNIHFLNFLITRCINANIYIQFMKLLIEVQTFNRKTITEICLNQIKNYKEDAFLKIVNDYSTEYDNEWLKNFGDEVIIHEKKLSINRLKWRTFTSFLETDFTHLYMCDNDIYHDPEFISILRKYKGNNLPITLYRSSFIHSFGDGVSKYLKHWDKISLKSGLFGGASVFLNRDHIEKIVSKLPDEETWATLTSKEAWDSKIQKMIDDKKFYLIPKESYCEHFGTGGQNHKTKNSDYALNPTQYIKDISDEIWKKIEI